MLGAACVYTVPAALLLAGPFLGAEGMGQWGARPLPSEGCPIWLPAAQPPAGKSPMGKCLQGAVLLQGPPQELTALFCSCSSPGPQGRIVSSPGCAHGALGPWSGHPVLSAGFATTYVRKMDKMKALRPVIFSFLRPCVSTVSSCTQLSPVPTGSPAWPAGAP